MLIYDTTSHTSSFSYDLLVFHPMVVVYFIWSFSDHFSVSFSICSFFIEVKFYCKRELKITTAWIVLTSLGKAIPGCLRGRNFSNFSVRSAPIDGVAPLR